MLLFTPNWNPCLFCNHIAAACVRERGGEGSLRNGKRGILCKVRRKGKTGRELLRN